MKATIFLLLISGLSVFASETYAQTKTITLQLKNASLKEILKNIEDQSEFYFMYSEKIIDVNRKVTVDIKNKKIDDALNQLFAGTNVMHSVRDRFILLTTPEVSDVQFAGQQQRSVSGTVTDDSGQPLPGVTVVVKGTTEGTVT
ncbi:STN domain-containing protein, partial [Mariniphaga sediminis]